MNIILQLFCNILNKNKKHAIISQICYILVELKNKGKQILLKVLTNIGIKGILAADKATKEAGDTVCQEWLQLNYLAIGQFGIPTMEVVKRQRETKE